MLFCVAVLDSQIWLKTMLCCVAVLDSQIGLKPYYMLLGMLY